MARSDWLLPLAPLTAIAGLFYAMSKGYAHYMSPIAFVVLLIIILVQRRRATMARAGVWTAEPCPPISSSALAFLSGDKADCPALADLDGTDPLPKVLVIEFWATWCPPCRAMLPHMSALQTKRRHDVQVLSISGEKVHTVAAFVERLSHEIEYTIAVDEERAIVNAFGDQFTIPGIPHCFVVSRDRTVVWHGNPASDNLDLAIDTALKRE